MSLGKVDIKALPRSERDTLASLLSPKTTEYIVHTPYPKQAAFMLLDIKEAFYGGAAGGGKSDALLMCALQYVDIPGYTAILFRKTFADLTKPGALIDRALTWLAPWIGHPDPAQRIRWSDKEKKLTFPSGAIVQFGYMETAKDRFNYQGGEYQFIGFDEVTHMLEICYTYMFSRLRRLKDVDIPLRVRAASNPPDDGDNAEWVYDRFVNPATKDPKRIFIPAGMDDNPHLDTESYTDALEELDPVTRARLRDGLWEIKRTGNMFKRDWFEEVEAPPQTGRRLVRFWDCAATEVDVVKKRQGKKPDYTVGLKMSEKDGVFYVEDIIHVQKSALGVEEIQRDTAKSDGYNVRIREEEEPGASGKYTIDNKRKNIFPGYSYEGVRNTGSKIERAMAVSAAAERGSIKIVRGCRNLEAFYTELEGFPAAPNDDLVDGLSGAFNALGILPKIFAPEMVGASDNSSYWEESEESMYQAVPQTGSYWGR